MYGDAMLMDLYRCPAEPARWPQLLDRLCEQTGACSAVVQSFAFDGDGVRLGWQAMDSRTQRGLGRPDAQLLSHENPRLDRRRGLRGLNRVVRDEELFDRDDPARETLQRRLAHIGMGRFIGALQPLEGGLYLGIALHRALDDSGDFDAAQVTRLEHLAPHLRQACELSEELHSARAGLALLRTHLDGLRCGLVVCDRDAQVQWLNRRARGLVDSGAELHLHGRTLRARRPADAAAVHKLLADAPTEARFLALGDGAQALHLAVRASGSSVLMAITRGADATAVPVEAWSTLLQVTPAEAALVATLAEGGTLEQHAQWRGVSIGTVRGQLKQVLAKTGTNRQAELVRLALSSAAAHVLASVPDLRCA
jgi:DNA-binding CsgD family transcriptional regulator